MGRAQATGMWKCPPQACWGLASLLFSFPGGESGTALLLPPLPGLGGAGPLPGCLTVSVDHLQAQPQAQVDTAKAHAQGTVLPHRPPDSSPCRSCGWGGAAGDEPEEGGGSRHPRVLRLPAAPLPFSPSGPRDPQRSLQAGSKGQAQKQPDHLLWVRIKQNQVFTEKKKREISGDAEGRVGGGPDPLSGRSPQSIFSDLTSMTH